jgi:hypothetical protein
MCPDLVCFNHVIVTLGAVGGAPVTVQGVPTWQSTWPRQYRAPSSTSARNSCQKICPVGKKAGKGFGEATGISSFPSM